MNKPWMPVVAGILDIVSGAFGVLMGLFMALPIHAARAAEAAPGGLPRFGPHPGGPFPPMPHFFFPGMGLCMGITMIVIGALAIVGGVYSLRIRNWGLALAGAIGAVITGRILGIVALIFIVLGRGDFESR